MHGEVTARPVRLPADLELLISVYGATRRPELDMLGWTEGQIDAFIRMQFEAQDRHYRSFYPGARHSIVEVGARSAGRLIVDRVAAEIRIVDLALLPAFRRAGIGSAVVERLCEEADANGLPIRCHVEQGNEAKGFWEQLGLVATRVDGAHIAMERVCVTSPR
ncbi:MAG TPA: GNAT family N-acetyltransferase [Solirubrobacteraceae bacterium]|jgi:ribosomal protein S18 acetylase RimI-like enzyme|nr:GNAT family N-acetyltransferase [Solirubrobacteraceae bacterium]